MAPDGPDQAAEQSRYERACQGRQRHQQIEFLHLGHEIAFLFFNVLIKSQVPSPALSINLSGYPDHRR
jgi:hypothetical protein